MLCLDVPAPDWCDRGVLADTDRIGFELLYETVPAAWPETVIAGDRQLVPAFVEAAKRLEAADAKAIIGDCGFMIAYQRDVAKAVRVPAALSSLSALPMLHALARPGEPAIGVLTYDATALTEAHLITAWPADRHERVVIEDIRDTASWRDWVSRTPAYDFGTALSDVMAAAHRLFDRAPSVQFLVIECTCMVLFRAMLRREFGIPVIDIATVADFLMASLDPGDPVLRFEGAIPVS